MKKIEKIIEVKYEARQNRAEHPEGEFDGAGRFYPDKNERCACCDDIREPSRRFPYSYMAHCRSKKHVANLVKKKENVRKNAKRRENYRKNIARKTVTV